MNRVKCMKMNNSQQSREQNSWMNSPRNDRSIRNSCYCCNGGSVNMSQSELFSSSAFQCFQSKQMGQLMKYDPLNILLKLQNSIKQQSIQQQYKVYSKLDNSSGDGDAISEVISNSVDQWRNDEKWVQIDKQMKKEYKKVEKGWRIIKEVVQRTQRDLVWMNRKNTKKSSIQLQSIQQTNQSQSQQSQSIQQQQSIQQNINNHNDSISQSRHNEQENSEQLYVLQGSCDDMNSHNNTNTNKVIKQLKFESTSSKNSYGIVQRMKQGSSQSSVHQQNMYLNDSPTLLPSDNIKLMTSNEQQVIRSLENYQSIKRETDKYEKVESITEYIHQMIIDELKNEQVYIIDKQQQNIKQQQQQTSTTIQQWNNNNNNSQSIVSLGIDNAIMMGIRCSYENVKEFINELINKLLEEQGLERLIECIEQNDGLDGLERLTEYRKQIKLDQLDDRTNDERIDGIDDNEYQSIINTKQIIDQQIFGQISRDQGIQQIHDKLVFDCFEQQLRTLKPYSVSGRPYCWQNYQLQLSSVCPLNTTNSVHQLITLRDRVLEQAAYLCGFIHEREETMFYLDEEYLQQIREDRMSKMLANEIYEAEKQWLIYNHEEAQVAIEIADLVQQEVMDQVVNEFIQLLQVRQVQDYFQ